MFNLSARVTVYPLLKGSDWYKKSDMRVVLLGRYLKRRYEFGVVFDSRALMDPDLFELYSASPEDVWEMLLPRVEPLNVDDYAMQITWMRTIKPEIRGECGYFSVGSDAEIARLKSPIVRKFMQLKSVMR